MNLRAPATSVFVALMLLLQGSGVLEAIHLHQDHLPPDDGQCAEVHCHAHEPEPLSDHPQPSNTDDEPEPCDLCLQIHTHTINAEFNDAVEARLPVVKVLPPVVSWLNPLDRLTSIPVRGPPLI